MLLGAWKRRWRMSFVRGKTSLTISAAKPAPAKWATPSSKSSVKFPRLASGKNLHSREAGCGVQKFARGHFGALRAYRASFTGRKDAAALCGAGAGLLQRTRGETLL